MSETQEGSNEETKQDYQVERCVTLKTMIIHTLVLLITTYGYESWTQRRLSGNKTIHLKCGAEGDDCQEDKQMGSRRTQA